jgi:hypothetical protein
MSILKNYFKQNSVMHSFSSCQWPIGDPQEKDFHFCEADTVAGKPYCQSHCDVAYIDEKELKKEKEAQKKSSHCCLSQSLQIIFSSNVNNLELLT